MLHYPTPRAGTDRVGAPEIQCKTLGMKVEIFDLNGKNIEDEGVPGELVCTRPHPSQPLGFWGDESGEKVRKAYFSTYTGWCLHGRDRACSVKLTAVQAYGTKATSSSRTRRRRG